MVDIRDQTNKELAMRLVTDIQSGDAFYTDLNGFQVSPTWGDGEAQLYRASCTALKLSISGFFCV